MKDADKLLELLEEAPRAAELAKRLVAAGPKAAHVTASETHEISDFVIEAIDVIRTLATDDEGRGEGMEVRDAAFYLRWALNVLQEHGLTEFSLTVQQVHAEATAMLATPEPPTTAQHADARGGGPEHETAWLLGVLGEHADKLDHGAVELIVHRLTSAGVYKTAAPESPIAADVGLDEAAPVAQRLDALAQLRRGAPLHESSECEAAWLTEAAALIRHLAQSGGEDAKDARRWRHARHHALVQLLDAYPTCDTCDVGLDHAVDVAIADKASTVVKDATLESKP